jgi:NAD(P)-dependent dehydrogenase (short-subunit alcohol dehydrogenase family)
MSSAVIVGAGPGLGFAIARRVAREGMAVSVISRGATPREVCAEIAREGGLASAFVGDSTDDTSLSSALDAATDTYGTPDLVVYNAAAIRLDTPDVFRRSDHLAAWNVNVLGALATVAHLAPAMRARGRGTVVLTSGMPTPDHRYTSLSLGKSGLRALAAILREDLQRNDIHVATVTIDCHMVPGTDSDPELVAEHYWTLHTQPRGSWTDDIVHHGSTPV